MAFRHPVRRSLYATRTARTPRQSRLVAGYGREHSASRPYSVSTGAAQRLAAPGRRCLRPPATSRRVSPGCGRCP